MMGHGRNRFTLGDALNSLHMKRRRPRPNKVIMHCPRCGVEKQVRSIELRHMIMCPVCGSGMREKMSAKAYSSFDE